MNEEYLKLRSNSRKLILQLLSDDSIYDFSEVHKPTVDYDSMKHLLPLDKLDLHYRGVGAKSIEAVALWATGKTLPSKINRKCKKIKLFGYEFRITITYKSIK